jgi:molybdate transport system substrate-binding protein
MLRIFLAIPLISLYLPVSAQTLLIAAASDLAPLEQPLQHGFQQQTGIRLRFSFGSSGMLAKQIANGAPFDVFLSANEQFVDEVERLGFVWQRGRKVYALGRLGLWSRSGLARSLEDLVAPGVRHLAIPNPKHAPYGVAARELLQATGLWEGLEAKLVYGENVRQAFEFASTGNADAVLTSWTLVHDKGGKLLPASHTPLRQSAAVLTASRRRPDATKFLEFLVSPAGQAILQAGGLSPRPAASR